MGAKANLVVNNGKGVKYGVGITDGNWGKKITAVPTTGKMILVKDNVSPVTNKCCTGLKNSSALKEILQPSFAAVARLFKKFTVHNPMSYRGNFVRYI